jgi:hypothetical protein
MQVKFIDLYLKMLDNEIEQINQDIEVIKNTITEKSNHEELTKEICE